MRPSQLLAAVIAVSSVSAAWTDSLGTEVKDVLYGRGQDFKNILYGRQDEEKSSAKPTATQEDDAKPTATQEDDTKPTATQEDDAKTTDGAKQTDKVSPTTKEGDKITSGPVTEKATSSTRTRKAKTTFDPNLPAGGISMITPAALAGPQYYKVGDWVQLVWNYTSVSKYPDNIDVMATCTANQATYTLAVNQTVNGTMGSVLWDTGAYQATASIPLLTETYTLMIYDSASSPSAAPLAGYLGVDMSFRFGIYTPQPYVNWTDFHCANCNSGLSPFEKLTLKAMLITCGTTVFSLLYFGISFGVL